MEQRKDVMLAGWLGVVGIVLTVVGGVFAEEFAVPAGSSSVDIIDFYQTAAFDGAYVAGVILETVGFLLVMGFLLKFAEVAQGDREGRSWPGAVIGASVIVGTVLTLFAEAGHAAATFRASNGGLGGDGYVLLTDAGQTAYWVSLPAWALALGTGGALILQERTFPSWLGWAALIIGLANLAVSFVDSVEVWDAATGLGGLWFLTTAIYMLVRADRYSALEA